MSDASRRLRWLCRRGMGELDRLLQPFFDDAYDRLPAAQQRALASLLELDDPELFALLAGREPIEDPEIARLVDAIRYHAGH
jgi:antitoxin CptB